MDRAVGGSMVVFKCFSRTIASLLHKNRLGSLLNKSESLGLGIFRSGIWPSILLTSSPGNSDKQLGLGIFGRKSVDFGFRQTWIWIPTLYLLTVWTWARHLASQCSGSSSVKCVIIIIIVIIAATLQSYCEI